MADQIPRIKPKWLILHFKRPQIFFQILIAGLCMLALSIYSVQTAACPPSVPSSAATITEQCTFDLYFDGFKSKYILNSILRSFSGKSSTKTYGAIRGSVSNSLYYLYWIQKEKKGFKFWHFVNIEREIDI